MPALEERFGKYHILSRIARGGMADVYKVKTVGVAGFEKIQALKRILPNLARQKRFIRSFVDEARIAAQLNHRNIVQVFDFGMVDDELFLSMELVDGVDLRTALERGKKRGMRLTVPLACYVASEVAHGLDYAHNKLDAQRQPLDIVHCDISPQNVMLSNDGYVKILDFGVARAGKNVVGTREWTRRLRGKPRYMAPEQTRGDQPTAATDVFAVGIIAWEMLTGLTLFEGDTLREVLEAVRRSDIPLLDRLNPEVPRHVADAVARALSAEPRERGTADELYTTLARASQLADTPGNARVLAQWLRGVYAESDAAIPVPTPAPTPRPAANPFVPSVLPPEADEWGTVTTVPPKRTAQGSADTRLERVTRRMTATRPASGASGVSGASGASGVSGAPDDRPAASHESQPEEQRPTQNELPAFGHAPTFVTDGSIEERITTPWIAVDPELLGDDNGHTRTVDGGRISAVEPTGESTEQTARAGLFEAADEATGGHSMFGPSTTTVIVERDAMLENIDEDGESALPGALMEKRRVVATAALVHGESHGACAELLRMLGELAYKHGAVVHTKDADSLIAVFGLEVAGEDDVAKAMGYALDAVETARETNANYGGNVTMRIAARAGIVATPADAGNEKRGYRLIGDAVEETRGLARSAEPGKPLLSGGEGRLTSAYYAFRELPARRHRRRRLRVLELLGPRTFDERARALHARTGRFVGRFRELAQLSQALTRSTAKRRCVTVAVVGPAGVGKSRLLSEFVARTESAPPAGQMPNMSAVATMPGTKAAPFALIIDLLQAMLSLPPERGEAARGQLARRTRQVLTASASGSGASARESASRDSGPMITLGEVDEIIGALETAMELRDGVLVSALHASSDLRARVLGALHSLRNALAPVERPVVTIIEDVHLADKTSVELLRESITSWTDRPAFTVLSTVADTEFAGSLSGWVDEVINLSELSGQDIEELIEDRLADAATPGRIATIAQRAGGNPLFIEQLAIEARDVGEIPPTVRAVITARVDRLTGPTKAVLQHAAVAGSSFRAPILEDLLGRDIAIELSDLCDEELLSREGISAADLQQGALRFAAELVRDAVYESLSATARRETHAALGQLLLARHQAGCDEPPGTIAEHLELGGLLPQASAYWLRAGRVALAAGDVSAAIDGFSHTLTIEEQRRVGERSEASLNRQRAALKGREQASRSIGDHKAQQADIERLLELARDEPDMLGDVKNRVALLNLRTGDFQGAVQAAEEAEIAARACLDELTVGEAMRIRGEAFVRMGQFEYAMSIARQALALFERIGAGQKQTEALIGIGRIHLFAARYEQARQDYRQIVKRVEMSGDPWLERVVRNHVAIIYRCLGRYEEAMRAAMRAVDICRRYGDRAREGDSLSVCGIIAMDVGRFLEARGYFTRALRILENTQSRWSLADCLVYAGITECRLGDRALGVRQLEQAESIAQDIGATYVRANALAALSMIALERGWRSDIARAVRSTETAVTLAREAKLIGTEIIALSRLADALMCSGDGDRALARSSQAVRMLDKQRFIEGPEQEVFFTHYRISRSLGAPRARAMLERAHSEVSRKLESIDKDAWRQAFQTSVPLNVAIVEAMSDAR